MFFEDFASYFSDGCRWIGEGNSDAGAGEIVESFDGGVVFTDHDDGGEFNGGDDFGGEVFFGGCLDVVAVRRHVEVATSNLYLGEQGTGAIVGHFDGAAGFLFVVGDDFGDWDAESGGAVEGECFVIGGFLVIWPERPDTSAENGD